MTEANEDAIRQRMTASELVNASEQAHETASAYLKVLREEIPADHHFGSVHSIHTLKDALLALAGERETAAINDEELARILEDAAFMNQNDHAGELVEVIRLLIRTIHGLRPNLAHSSNWVVSEDDFYATLAENRWLGRD